MRVGEDPRYTQAYRERGVTPGNYGARLTRPGFGPQAAGLEDMVKRLAGLPLAAAIALSTLAWSIASILKLQNVTNRLNEETLAVARAAAGPSVTLETAESALAQRTGGRAYGGLMAPLAGLYDALRAEPQVVATAVAYASDGTMTTTLAAPTVDPVNRVLIALQRNNYRVTAVPRQAPDGRMMVETTIRSGP